MNILVSHAILQSVRDTAIRFADSEGGGKGWLDILSEIICHLPVSSKTLMSQFEDGERFMSDEGDVTFQGPNLWEDSSDEEPVTPIRGTWGIQLAIGQRGLRGKDGMGELEDVYQWFISPDSEPRHAFCSRECAWFIERLRILGFPQHGGRDGRDDLWLYEPDFHVGGNPLSGTREAFERSEITWYTLVKFLQFIHDKSNWTTPPFLDRGPRGRRKNQIKWCYHKILEESGTIDLISSSLEPDSWDPIAAIHVIFNQEQGDIIEVETPDQLLVNLHLPVISVERAEDPEVKKKRQLVEILSILEDNAKGDKISEGDYKDYADLLMSFHGMIRPPVQSALPW